MDPPPQKQIVFITAARTSEFKDRTHSNNSPETPPISSEFSSPIYYGENKDRLIENEWNWRPVHNIGDYEILK